ncbi:hypothetical protein [Lysobacter sp. Root604]|uniref:hypothetical protein n=1 Tax=Lysobacter sp. Root604 TaxID=1736568 RepID=UPI0006FD592B|nr:hypothetical protein [Lysobacter sp. Root604]KRA16390.1 hypothetical protein ASD69_16905 [Lysobacter sp. Root604]
MTAPDESSNIYAAPSARPLEDPGKPFRYRFWLTSLLSSVAMPVVWYVFLTSSPSVWGAALLLLGCWLIPVFWILLPQIRQPDGFAGITSGRFIGVSAAYLAVAFVASCVLLIGLMYLGALLFGVD